jgi:hypothetical protein
VLANKNVHVGGFWYLVLAAVLTAVGASSCAQQKSAAPASGKPELTVVGGDTVNWGKIGPGTLTRALTIKNTGGDTLKIAGVKPSCGCTTAPLTHNTLPPGDTATINISIDMKNHNGVQHKSITITSNDSTKPSHVVNLTADIVVDITAVPNYFPPDPEVKVNKVFDTALQLKNTSAAPVTLQPPTAQSDSSVTITFDMKSPVQLQPGDSTRVIAHVTAKKQGSYNNEVEVKTSSAQMPSIKLPLYVNAKN